jgi:hypothetical protein
MMVRWSWLMVLVGSLWGSGDKAVAAEIPAVLVSIPGETQLLRVSDPDQVARLQAAGLTTVAEAVNDELRDVARALRSLDQSYAIRGFHGCGAATAGSVFIDWHARGMTAPHGLRVVAPEPIVLGVPKWGDGTSTVGCGHRGRSRCGCRTSVAPPVDPECDCQRTQPTSPTLLPPVPMP